MKVEPNLSFIVCLFAPPSAISAPFGGGHSVLYGPGPSPHFDDGDDNRLVVIFVTSSMLVMFLIILTWSAILLPSQTVQSPHQGKDYSSNDDDE